MRKAKYTYEIITIENLEVAVIIDLDNDINSPSVTNTVEAISKDLKIPRLLYQGSDKYWCYWDEINQYVPITENNQAIINDKNKAIKVLKSKIKELTMQK